MPADPDPGPETSVFDPEDGAELENLLAGYVLGVLAEEPAAVGALPRTLQAWFVAFVVDREVMAGGFNQLLFKAPEIASMAPDAFVHLGMDAAAVIAQDAWHLYDVVRARHDEARADGSFAAFSATYEPPVFEELDLMYAESATEFTAARIAYVKAHPEEFAT
ncbi:MAG: DUF4375 domain-containing protein [Actinomycetota bacterium]